jgi:hypothetical protein
MFEESFAAIFRVCSQKLKIYDLVYRSKSNKAGQCIPAHEWTQTAGSPQIWHDRSGRWRYYHGYHGYHGYTGIYVDMAPHTL